MMCASLCGRVPYRGPCPGVVALYSAVQRSGRQELDDLGQHTAAELGLEGPPRLSCATACCFLLLQPVEAGTCSATIGVRTIKEDPGYAPHELQQVAGSPEHTIAVVWHPNWLWAWQLSSKQ